jgi:hypothetical protein
MVNHIPATALSSGPIPVVFTATGPGALTPLALPGPTLNGLCFGGLGPTTATIFTGFNVFLCPTGPGSGTVQACISGQTIDTQPNICSNTLTFTYILPGQARVVPYVSWAGEKRVLTKCFGGSGLMAGAPVEFTLAGGGGPANAALIPAGLPTSFVPGTGTGGTGIGGTGGGTAIQASQDTVWTITDVNGCATVIVFAASEGRVVVDASLYSTASPAFSSNVGLPIINEHAFEIFYLKFDHITLEDLGNPANAGAAGNGFASYTSSTLTSSLGFATTPAFYSGLFGAPPATFVLPKAPGSNPPGPSGYSVPLCLIDYVRAQVHGYFELPGDPSGRPATNVGISNSPSGAAGSYVLPAGRWVLPEDWPVLATFAGFDATGNPLDFTPSSVYAWDLNSGWVFNPGSERAVVCDGPKGLTLGATSGAINNGPPLISLPLSPGNGTVDYTTPGDQVSEGPCFGQDVTGASYATAPDPVIFSDGSQTNCVFGITAGMGPFDITQGCTDPYPLANSPSGSSGVNFLGFGTGGIGRFAFGPLSENSTYLPNGTLNWADTPMPQAPVSFGVTSGPGFLNQVNKSAVYVIHTSAAGADIYPDMFYKTAIPTNPLIPPIANNGGYLWNTFNFSGGTTAGPTLTSAFLAGFSGGNGTLPGTGTFCPAGFTAVVSGAVTVCYFSGPAPSTTPATITQAECAAIPGSTFTQTGAGPPPTGTCYIAGGPNGTGVPPGTNATTFGGACPAIPGLVSGGNTVTLVNATGFVQGMTVTITNRTTGAVIATGLTVVSVVGNVVTFDDASGLCVLAGTAVVTANEVAVTVGFLSAVNSTLFEGASIEICAPVSIGGQAVCATANVAFIPFSTSGGGVVFYISGAGALARIFGVNFPFPPGAVITLGANVDEVPVDDSGDFYNDCGHGIGNLIGVTFNPGQTNASCTGGNFSAANLGPYPFWQWVPNPAPATGTPRTATVYSDNHGEAWVSLETGVAAQVVPVNGTCPANYNPAVVAGVVVNCILNYASLSSAYSNVAAARTAFSAASPGCVTTTAAGGIGAAPSATASASPTLAVSGTGPQPGQICINSLGGIEFGTGATLGTTTVQAIADYPYFRGLDPAISSGAITKIWTSGFLKSLVVSPLPGGTPGPSGTTTYTVTITVLDICGTPVVGEPVQVFALGNAGAVVLAPVGAGAVATSTNAATVSTNANGIAVLSLEVLGTAIGNQGLVIKAVFPLENVERFVTVIPGSIPGQTVTVMYPPGYNMIGGPPGSNFTSAEKVFTYNPATNAFVDVTGSDQNLSSAPPACIGYWAYFAGTTTVLLPSPSTVASPATCTLQPGWNLVGNPFTTPAALPSGTTGLWWNPSAPGGGAYQSQGFIPVGGALLIQNTGTTATTLTLTAT